MLRRKMAVILGAATLLCLVTADRPIEAQIDPGTIGYAGVYQPANSNTLVGWVYRDAGSPQEHWVFTAAFVYPNDKVAPTPFRLQQITPNPYANSGQFLGVMRAQWQPGWKYVKATVQEMDHIP